MSYIANKPARRSPSHIIIIAIYNRPRTTEDIQPRYRSMPPSGFKLMAIERDNVRTISNGSLVDFRMRANQEVTEA